MISNSEGCSIFLRQMGTKRKIGELSRAWCLIAKWKWLEFLGRNYSQRRTNVSASGKDCFVLSKSAMMVVTKGGKARVNQNGEDAYALIPSLPRSTAIYPSYSEFRVIPAREYRSRLTGILPTITFYRNCMRRTSRWNDESNFPVYFCEEINGR